jgi:hypothetical protein
LFDELIPRFGELNGEELNTVETDDQIVNVDNGQENAILEQLEGAETDGVGMSVEGLRRIFIDVPFDHRNGGLGSGGQIVQLPAIVLGIAERQFELVTEATQPVDLRADFKVHVDTRLQAPHEVIVEQK